MIHVSSHACSWQALALGQQLHKRSTEQLGFIKGYSSETVSCRSTNYDRTIKTLVGVLTGTFPGCSETIPVVVSSDLDEIMYADVSYWQLKAVGGSWRQLKAVGGLEISNCLSMHA